jgi:hypothetical protein
MKFTNTSGATCTVYGYPGVSAVTASGSQLGSAAGRSTTSSPATITLAPGQSTTATLQVTNVGNYTPSTCGPTTASALRVYAPNQTTPSSVAFSSSVCGKSGTVYMTITPVGSSGASGGGGGATTARCTTSGLAVALGSGSGAAGSSYYPLTFTNRSGHSCTIGGYPGVSAIGPTGSQLGSPAGRDTTNPAKTITLANGGTATATLQVADVGNYTPSTCQPTTAASLRVFPPNQTQSTTVAFSASACAKAGQVYLHVTAVK